MKTDYPNADKFADAVRVLLYGEGNAKDLIQDLAEVLAKYDGVPTSDLDNRLLKLLESKNSWKLWLDDLADTVKPPPDNSWIVARSSAEAKSYIDKLGPPSYISFDFDLGDGDTAEHVYKYLYTHYPNADIDYDIHSENNQGWKLIQSYMDSWKKSKSLP